MEIEWLFYFHCISPTTMSAQRLLTMQASVMATLLLGVWFTVIAVGVVLATDPSCCFGWSTAPAGVWAKDACYYFKSPSFPERGQREWERKGLWAFHQTVKLKMRGKGLNTKRPYMNFCILMESAFNNSFFLLNTAHVRRMRPTRKAAQWQCTVALIQGHSSSWHFLQFPTD